MKYAIVLLLMAVSLSAVTFEKGLAAYESEDYKTAASIWISLAEQGDVASQKSLAVMYEDGEGVGQDSAKALFWYQKAALQGDVNSQLLLAMSYCHGDGVAKDLKQCAKWAKMAKDSGENVAILWVEFDLGKYQ